MYVLLFIREKVRKICNCPRPHSSFVTEMRTDEFIKRILILKDNLFRVVFQITGDHKFVGGDRVGLC